MKKFLRTLLFCLSISIACTAAESDSWQLLPQAQVDSVGIFLDQIMAPPADAPALAHLRLARAPRLGQAIYLSRTQLADFARTAGALASTNWSGAAQIRVSRRLRSFEDSDLLELLTTRLQKDYIKGQGDLEIHLSRPWTKIQVPDESLSLKLTEMPAQGVTPTFILTFELWNGREHVGAWQVAVQASVWREVPIAHETLNRGQLLKDADVTMERRDILLLRDVLLNFPPTDDSLELTGTVPAGRPILNRGLRDRPLILRGQMVEAVFQDGALGISLMVETLQDGQLGQTVRVRNPKTKREIYGKVENEKTVRIIL